MYPYMKKSHLKYASEEELDEFCRSIAKQCVSMIRRDELTREEVYDALRKEYPLVSERIVCRVGRELGPEPKKGKVPKASGVWVQ